jgi:hypothetical protein
MSIRAEPFGCHAHHGEDGDRVHLHAADAVGHGVRMIAAETVRHRQAIVEEADMELAGLEHASDVAVVVRGHEAGRGIRMPPGADEVGAVLGLQEGHESHLAHRLFLAARRRCPSYHAAAVLPMSTRRVRGVIANSHRPLVDPPWMKPAPPSWPGLSGHRSWHSAATDRRTSPAMTVKVKPGANRV